MYTSFSLVCVVYCDLFVSPSARISQKTHGQTSPNFCPRSVWPWLGPPLAALRYVTYFRFCGWRHVLTRWWALWRVMCIPRWGEHNIRNYRRAKFRWNGCSKDQQRHIVGCTPGVKSEIDDYLAVYTLCPKNYTTQTPTIILTAVVQFQ